MKFKKIIPLRIIFRMRIEDDFLLLQTAKQFESILLKKNEILEVGHSDHFFGMFF